MKLGSGVEPIKPTGRWSWGKYPSIWYVLVAAGCVAAGLLLWLG